MVFLAWPGVGVDLRDLGALSSAFDFYAVHENDSIPRYTLLPCTSYDIVLTNVGPI